jgi:hypothetical protein
MKSTYSMTSPLKTGDRYACSVSIHYDPHRPGTDGEPVKEEVLYTVWGSSFEGARLRAERLMGRISAARAYTWDDPVPTHCEVTKKPITDCFVDAITRIGLNRRLVHPDAYDGLCLSGTWWRLVDGRWIRTVSP